MQYLEVGSGLPSSILFLGYFLAKPSESITYPTYLTVQLLNRVAIIFNTLPALHNISVYITHTHIYPQSPPFPFEL